MTEVAKELPLIFRQNWHTLQRVSLRQLSYL